MAENRRNKKEEEETTGWKYNGLPIPQGGHKISNAFEYRGNRKDRQRTVAAISNSLK